MGSNPTRRISRKKPRRSYSDEEFIEAVKTSRSWLAVFRKLGLKPGGGQYICAKRLSKQLNLSLNHMTGKGWNTGDCYRPVFVACPIEEVLVKNSNHSTSKLKHRLWKEGLLEKKCYHCGSKEWFGKINHLQLEHINGDRTDNRLKNLTILCANWHSLTKTYCGKNNYANR